MGREKDGGSLPRWDLGVTPLGSTKAVSLPTIDQEPLLYDTSYDIWVKVYNSVTGELVETKTVTVLTPPAKVATPLSP